MNCPLCGHSGYAGLFAFECGSHYCRNYVARAGRPDIAATTVKSLYALSSGGFLLRTTPDTQREVERNGAGALLGWRVYLKDSGTATIYAVDSKGTSWYFKDFGLYESDQAAIDAVQNKRFGIGTGVKR